MKELEEKKYYYLNKEEGRTEGPYTMEQLSEQLVRDSSLAAFPLTAEGATHWSTLRQVIDSKGASLEPEKKAPSLWARIFKRGEKP